MGRFFGAAPGADNDRDGRTARFFRALLLLAFCATCLLAAPSPARAEATPAPAATPVPTPFTFAWLSDTQSSVYHEPKAMIAVGDWLHENAEKENILCVLHTGDLVDNGFTEWQWQNFELAYDRFSGDLPFFPIAGNHDLDRKLQIWDGYLARPYVSNAVPDEQQYADGKAAYMTVSAGGTDFIIVGIGYGAERETAAWVRNVFRQYPRHVGILMLHDYLHVPDNRLYEYGPFTLAEVVKKCENIRLVLCGHFRGTGYREDPIDDVGDGTPNRVVKTMLFNYQAMKYGGGIIRLLTFDPADRSITVSTFSALTGHPMQDRAFRAPVFYLADAF